MRYMDCVIVLVAVRPTYLGHRRNVRDLACSKGIGPVGHAECQDDEDEEGHAETGCHVAVKSVGCSAV